ncbi:MAG TPA: DUF3429 domain-containing protein [Marinobacter sp.]|uniref:DUF3429 domain-containing protein n=1 Tax=Marinobacter sp. TaxID=50741 RepID=UPI000EDB69B1|nr:DUF3429 domain-containing protein [Marinobacter sp.]MBC7191554.1 DUF3429 domain-containing protein [Marinobacter sp.]HCW88761.1 DUF3429 domain-containing protein [Marinobacter sp.]
MIAVSRLAFLFGLAGLIPFLAGVAGLLLMPGHSALITAWFYLYSAGILAFMGGVYWPLSMQLENRCYPLSPLITLLLSQAFFLVAAAGILISRPWQGLLFVVAYIALYLVDRLLMQSYWPQWYLRLRGLLTVVVIACQIGVAGWHIM